MKYIAIHRHQLFFFIFSCFLISWVYFITAVSSNILLFITNLIVMLVSLVGMALKAERVYSLEKIIYVFFFFFMGVVPLNDLHNDNWYWGGRKIEDDTLIMTNVFVIIGLLAFYFGSHIKVYSADIKNCLPSLDSQRINRVFFLVVFLSLAFLILYVFDFNLIRLLVRGGDFDLEQGVQLNQIGTLIFNNFIRPAPILMLFVYHYMFIIKSNNVYNKPSQIQFLLDKLIFIFIFGLSTMLIAPTGVPRFLAATLYIPFVLIFTRLWNKPYRMQCSVLASLLIIMPILDKFRNFDSSEFDLSFDLSFLNHGHFDAYQNFARVIQIDLITCGYQLLGPLLFFVPRSIWSDKPIGSGAFLAESANYNFQNISMPFIAEGYINFGLLGVFIFMFSLGLIVNKLDSFAWKLKASGAKSIQLYYYYILFGLSFFVMRGDLMSSFAYTIGVSCSFWLIVVLLRMPMKLKVGS